MPKAASAPQSAATPHYLRASLKLGGINDPEEHEAEHAASTIAGGGTYQVRDPGGSTHLRAVGINAPSLGEHPPVRSAVAPPVLDPGASGAIRRFAAAPILDPGASGRIRCMAAFDPVAAQAESARKIERARAEASKPLPSAVRARLERGFGERMDNVRVHTGKTASAAAHSIGARAYTEGERIVLGPGESEHDLRLMAHEATHVVQNRRAAGIFRARPVSPGVRTAPQRVAETAPEHDIRRSEVPVTQPLRRLPFGLGTVLDQIADWANVLPGYRLLTMILGVNPINMAKVELNGANIIRAAVELIPFGGLIVKALDTYGIFEKGGTWVEQQIATLGMAGAALRDALMNFLSSLGAGDLLSPSGVWDRAKRIFTEPIDRLTAFFKAVGSGIVDLIKAAILKPLAALAAQTRAWDLLIAVLGNNPITGETVTPSPDAVIGGFMKLAGQDDVWASIQQAKAGQRAWAWFQKAMNDLLGYVRQVPGMFVEAIKSFQVSDLLDLPGALLRIGGKFADFAVQFVHWALDAAWQLLEIVFDVVSPGALTYIKQTGAALKGILKNPLPFVGNLVKAAKLGLQNFADNFLTHLKNGLINWLTGSLPGVYIPQAITLAEIGKFALSVLGISWAQIRAKIVKALGPTGEKIMQGLELAFDVVKALVTGGPAAAWEVIKDKLTNLKDMVIDAITGFVTDTIVKTAIPKLVSIFIPGAGFISAIISIYSVIQNFIQQIGKIAAAIKAFVDSIVAIAQGQIAGAAAKVENALAGVLPLAIGMLASFLSLGNIPGKVMGVIKTVQATVDKGLDAAIAWIVTKAKALFAKVFGKEDKKDERTAEQKSADLNLAIGEASTLQDQAKITEPQLKKGLAAIKRKYKMLSLELIVDATGDLNETIHVEGEINPKARTLPTGLAQLPVRFVKLPPTKIGKTIRRQQLETLFPTVKGMHRSHAVGPITGAELVLGLSAAPPEVNLSLMKRVELLMQTLQLNKAKGVDLYQHIDVEQIVVTRGEVYLLQRITYQIEARLGNQSKLIAEASIEVDYSEDGGSIKGRPHFEVEPIGFLAQ